MLLRRVMEHVRRQDWAAIGIDFIITVAGVFVGLQAANWNEARVDRLRAHSYLERIHGDLQADIRNYEGRLAFWSRVREYGRTCLAYAEGDALGSADPWPIVLACFQASQLAEFRTTEATYEELRSAGELNLITDRGLRASLADYYVNADNPSLSERPRYREHIRGIIPFEVQLYIWNSCYRSLARGDQEMRECSAPVDTAAGNQILRVIHSEPALLQELRYWMSTMEVASRIGSDRMDYARSIASDVDRQLQR